MSQHTLLRPLALALLAAFLFPPVPVHSQTRVQDPARLETELRGSRLVGTWYLALDAEPFGLPPGATLPGLAQFHQDGTFRILDGGDFGGPPFGTRDTTQVGSWRSTARGRFEGTTLFLQADALTGGVLAWQRVRLDLRVESRDLVVGTVNVDVLPCDQTAPLPIFACPDPIASSGQFQATPPPDVPIELKRLPASQP